MMNSEVLRKVPVIVFDLDGTVTDFRKIDNKIIRNHIFKNHKLTLALDKIAWKINEQDIIKNTTLMLKFRLLLYSLISGSNFKAVFEEYKVMYTELTMKEILKRLPYFKSLEEKGYHVIIISNNKITDRILIKSVEIYSTRSKILALENLQESCFIRLMVGNNLLDDIIPSYFHGIDYRYVGKKLKFLNRRRISDIEELDVEEII